MNELSVANQAPAPPPSQGYEPEVARRPAGEALEALVGFLAQAFADREDFKGFVRQLPDGDELITTLPGDVASARTAAYALTAAVISRGLLDREFFRLLLEKRRGRSVQVNELRQRCLAVDEPTGAIEVGVLLRQGRYRLEELVDHGAVASVWRAHDRQTDAPVAIKVLRRDMRDYRLRRWHFIKGASHLASISHPRVARVLDPHFSEMGHDFCVLELVHGKSLAEEVRSRRLEDPHAVIAVIADIGTGLAALHPRIFHGDVSPKNIIISANGHATLVDFDCASDVDELPMTQATGIAGTDPYASPEWRSRSEFVDHRTDIFSLGMTAVYALYGGKNLPTGLNDSRASSGPGPFIGTYLKCDTAIKVVLTRACSLELSDRYESVWKFCHDLRQCLRPVQRATRPRAAPAVTVETDEPVVERAPSTPPAAQATVPAPPVAEPPVTRPPRVDDDVAAPDGVAQPNPAIDSRPALSVPLPEVPSHSQTVRAVRAWPLALGVLAALLGTIVWMWAPPNEPAAAYPEVTDVEPSAPMISERRLPPAWPVVVPVPPEKEPSQVEPVTPVKVNSPKPPPKPPLSPEQLKRKLLRRLQPCSALVSETIQIRVTPGRTGRVEGMERCDSAYLAPSTTACLKEELERFRDLKTPVTDREPFVISVVLESSSSPASSDSSGGAR